MVQEKNMTSSQTKLTNSQKILIYLQKNSGEISNEELSRETEIDKTNIPREIKNLEEKGHVITKRYERVGRAKFVWFQLTISQNNMTSSQEKKATNSQKKKNTILEVPEKKNQKQKIQKATLENSNRQEVRFIEQMSQEIELFGRTIPLDRVREIAREILLNHRVLIKGVKYYLGVWRTRYYKYKKTKPEHFLIDEWAKAQETLTFLYEIEKLYKEMTNGK